MLSLNDKPLKQSDSENYVNIKTNRNISNLNNKDFLYAIIDNNFYICGSKEDIENFIIKNKIKKKNISYLNNSEKIKTDNLKRPELKKGEKLDLKELNFDELEPICTLDSVGTALFVPDSEDVEDIPISIANSMCPFSLSKIRGKAKIISVEDADTVKFLIYIKMSELIKGREVGRARGVGSQKKKDIAYPVITKHQEAGFFSVFTCRINGIDAAEHDTINGMFAKFLLEDYINSLSNIVYVSLDKFDKYGRTLADLYSDKYYLNNISNKLLGIKINEIPKIVKQLDIKYDKGKVSDEQLKVIVLPYGGGTKDESFKNLPQVSKGIIKKEDYKGILEKYRLK